MGQKVSPISFRLAIHKNWRSNWFSDHNYAYLLAQDIVLRRAIQDKLGRSAGINSIEIERNVQEVTININTSKPGIIIGRSGQGITQLKEYIEKRLLKDIPSNIKPDKNSKTKSTPDKVKINILEVRNPEIRANLVAQNIAQQLEKRIAYRRAVKSAIQKIMENREAKGVKINVAGRLGGVDIARREKFSNGSIPLSTLRSDIDYAHVDAFTTYGVIGIKVWIYKGEKIVEKSKGVKPNK